MVHSRGEEIKLRGNFCTVSTNTNTQSESISTFRAHTHTHRHHLMRYKNVNITFPRDSRTELVVIFLLALLWECGNGLTLMEKWNTKIAWHKTPIFWCVLPIKWISNVCLYTPYMRFRRVRFYCYRGLKFIYLKMRKSQENMPTMKI